MCSKYENPVRYCIALKTNSIKTSTIIVYCRVFMIFRTVKAILNNNSIVKEKKLVKEVQKKTGLRFNTINEHLYYFELEGRISKIEGSYKLNIIQLKSEQFYPY